MFPFHENNSAVDFLLQCVSNFGECETCTPRHSRYSRIHVFSYDPLFSYDSARFFLYLNSGPFSSSILLEPYACPFLAAIKSIHELHTKNRLFYLLYCLDNCGLSSITPASSRFRLSLGEAGIGKMSERLLFL